MAPGSERLVAPGPQMVTSAANSWSGASSVRTVSTRLTESQIAATFDNAGAPAMSGACHRQAMGPFDQPHSGVSSVAR